MTNPYMPQTYSSYGNPYLAKLDIVHVNGENGARAFQMPANSNTLLLDDTAPVVWLAQTDGAGYKTVTPYDITPHVPEPPVDVKALEERIKKLEEMLNDKSNVATTEQNKPNVWKSPESKTNDGYY